MPHVARGNYRTQKMPKKSPSAHHRATLSGYIFATMARIDNRKKKLLSSNISPTCIHNMLNFGPLAAEIGSLVWGTPANFNGFGVLAKLPPRSAQGATYIGQGGIMLASAHILVHSFIAYASKTVNGTIWIFCSFTAGECSVRSPV